jgi:2-amino-4-hydroxy-6-hydroxymethyldihydropteridine diphosphokinase
MRYWLGLGSNLGDRLALLRAAIAWLRGHGLAVEAVSAVFNTAPRDLPDQPDFLNAACRVAADLDPPAVLDAAKRLERDLGRVPGVRFGPRAIDCDILLWEGGTWRDERLEIPHPRLGERLFALLPLLDLDPDLTLPDGRRLARVAAALDARAHAVRRLGPDARLE